MKFYDRVSEITALRSIEQASAETAQMTMVVGRRRVGKTTLLKNAFKSVPFLYFFVANKNEIYQVFFEILSILSILVLDQSQKRYTYDF